jgi:hypothetical protein
MSRVLACLTAALAAAAAVTAVVINVVGSGRGAHTSFGAWGALPFLVAITTPATVGLILVLRGRATRIAWILLAGPLSVAIVIAADATAALALHENAQSTLGAWAAVVAQQWPVLFLWPLALAYLFPDGHLPSRRWRPFALAVCAACGGLVALLALQEEPETPYGKLQSPLPVTAPSSVEPLFWVCWAGLLVALFGGAVAMLTRYRAGDAQRRRQVLWLAYGALLVPLWLGGGSLVAVVSGSFSNVIDSLGLVVIQVWPAVAVWIAVTRHGLYAIDRLLNRTLVYVALTALLIATYALVALSVGLVVGGSAVSASAATLAAALAFRPLHGRIQGAVDRRFARARFDAVRLLRDFLDEVRDGRAEPEDLGGRWRSRSATRAPRSCSACRRPAGTRTGPATCSRRCRPTAARSR